LITDLLAAAADGRLQDLWLKTGFMRGKKKKKKEIQKITLATLFYSAISIH